MEKPKAPAFPYAGIICFLMGGLLLMSGGFRLGQVLVGIAIVWAAFAIILIVKRR